MTSSIPNAIASTEDFEFEALSQAVNYRKAVVRALTHYLSGNVVEIGAGIGQMTKDFLNLSKISRLLSVEPEPKLHERHKKNVPGGELVLGLVDDIPTYPWDSIVSINVLEHIEGDVQELIKYRKILAPQRGFVCLLVPARPEIYSPIDKDFGHYRRYTKSSLEAVLRDSGFEIVVLRYFNFIGYFAWFWTFKICRARHFGIDKVRFFDRHIFPWAYRLERLLPFLPFGQSLIAVGRA